MSTLLCKKRHEHIIETNETIHKISLSRFAPPLTNTRGSVIHRYLTKRHLQPVCSCGDAVSATGRLAYSTARKRQGTISTR